MKYRTRSSDVWARLVQEIITSGSWLPLFRATVLVLACTTAAGTLALVLILGR
jgi:hypothetical protein